MESMSAAEGEKVRPHRTLGGTAVFKLGRSAFVPGCWRPDEFGTREPPRALVRWGPLMAGREGVNEGVNPGNSARTADTFPADALSRDSLVAVACLFSGVMPDSVLSSSAGNSRLIVTRRSSDRFGIFGRLAICVDGAFVAKLRRGQAIALAMESGEHEVHVRMGGFRSDPVEVRLAPDDETRLSFGMEDPRRQGVFGWRAVRHRNRGSWGASIDAG
jgi:hypothetical protein